MSSNEFADLLVSGGSVGTSGIPEALATLESKIAAGTASVGVIGLGYVGLPLARLFARAGFSVTGFDIDPEKVASLNGGTSYIGTVSTDEVRGMLEEGRFTATANFQSLADMDAIVICVPTPLTRNREPDMSCIEVTTRQIAQVLRPGQLIVLESTTYPGTTREVVRPILEKTGLNSGTDFLLAFSPEREDPGNETFTTARIPKIVGGEDPNALRIACSMYGRALERVIPVSSLEAAEAVKLTENIFRCVNIALVNELKVVYDAMGIDVWEVIEGAKTKPFGYMPFYPGPGLGGHCIPIDPFYLTWKAREFDVATRFIELAGEINTRMPHYVVERLSQAMDSKLGRALRGSRILVLGVAYKKNIEDMRESPALKIIDLLQDRGCEVFYYDPHVPELPETRRLARMAGTPSVALEDIQEGAFDAAILCTDHDSFDLKAFLDGLPLIVDTRNAFGKAGIVDEKIVKG
ncbi:nucleotide sugar dehydrogenase [Azospirillum sp. Vi22]|uniref:nucleotide sugar dehydrogenase n=1 Tax=Azospirillum baldaniorum TaxID=1064539 RepID=UPI0011AA5577|nr:nucleotide sugar dehydrogenase [Azospirillum baldaniorum]NUB10707.1 nucleotide sugar dehydrogenase [Azospirillum baldaniorum]TWA60895.1 UDP-N-acetyl-D-glucosamine dehydrogenase [Azospirillum baldaniorum]